MEPNKARRPCEQCGDIVEPGRGWWSWNGTPSGEILCSGCVPDVPDEDCDQSSILPDLGDQ